jgi:hypothetical protein
MSRWLTRLVPRICRQQFNMLSIVRTTHAIRVELCRATASKVSAGKSPWPKMFAFYTLIVVDQGLPIIPREKPHIDAEF